MTAPVVRHRLVEHAVTGRYTVLLGLGLMLAVLGIGGFLLALSEGHADRAWQLFHVNWLYFTGLAGGSVALAAVHKIANAKWSGLIVRFAEAAVAFFPVSFVGFLLIFFVGYEHIYPDFHGLGHGKELWLSFPWMVARLSVGLLALFLLGWAFVRADLLPDVHEAQSAVSGSRARRFARMAQGFNDAPEGHRAQEVKIHRLAPIYILVYVIVFSLLAFDGIMALQPHWFSNLLGGFYFMGSFLGAHMLLALFMFYGGSQTGARLLISPKQRHDLGKLCFGFTVFWAYLMWAQFLVIWYGNLPEETGFVFARLWGPWLPVGKAVFVGLFLIPFIGLLGVAPKKFGPTLGLFATISLAALWLERYLLVLPSVTREHGPVVGLPEVSATVAFLGLFLLAYALFARTYPMVSPRLAEITLGRETHHEILGYEHEEAPEDYVTEEIIDHDLHPDE
jgi:hypothetical protein